MPSNPRDFKRDLVAAVAADLVDNLDQVPGRYRVLHGGIGRLGGGIGAAERECHEDGQATLLQERRGVATAGSVHWRALPRQLWMCDALHRLVIHLRRAVCTPPYRLEITLSPSCSRAFTGGAYEIRSASCRDRVVQCVVI